MAGWFIWAGIVLRVTLFVNPEALFANPFCTLTVEGPGVPCLPLLLPGPLFFVARARFGLRVSIQVEFGQSCAPQL
jgi:hypothetical protein